MNVDREAVSDEYDHLCLMKSRSNWPVWHYDGRWSCSLPKGHTERHEARAEHDPNRGVVWVGPWVDEEDAEPNVQFKKDDPKPGKSIEARTNRNPEETIKLVKDWMDTFGCEYDQGDALPISYDMLYDLYELAKIQRELHPND